MLMDFDSFEDFLSTTIMQRRTPRNRNAARRTAPSAMKRVGGGYVMREPLNVDLSSEEEMESRGEEEDYWFWKVPPGWPHFAIWDGVQDGSSKEELVSREKEDRFSKTPSTWFMS